MTDEMMNTVTEPKEQIVDTNTESSNKPKKHNRKRLFKTSTSLYILLTLIGVLLIGIGSGVAVFEFSEYKMANYRAIPTDPNLPPMEMQTTTLEASYEKGEQFKLDTTGWYFSGSYDIQYDNSLNDKVIIEVTAPKELYDVYLITQGENHYYLNCNVDAFRAFYLALEIAKDGYILEDISPATLKLTMSEAQAKNFKLNEERYKQQEAQLSYNERLNELHNEYNEQLNQTRNEYNEQLNEQRDEYTAQLDRMQEEYNNQLQELHESYDTQMEETREEYERRIAELEMQLNDARNALS